MTSIIRVALMQHRFSFRKYKIIQIPIVTFVNKEVISKKFVLQRMLNLQHARHSISLSTKHFSLLIAILSPLHENHNKRYSDCVSLSFTEFINREKI